MEAIFVKPWGGPGATDFDDRSYSGVKKIVLKYGDCVDSIQIQYDNYGADVWSQKHGGQGGGQGEVNLDFPNEYLTGISGYYGCYETDNDLVIRSLQFMTNKKNTSRLFGKAEGTPFSLQINGAKIVGFAGSYDAYLNKIGFYIRQS